MPMKPIILATVWGEISYDSATGWMLDGSDAQFEAEIALAVLGNHLALPDTVEVLATPRSRLSLAVASRAALAPATPPEVLVKLATCRFATVRSVIAQRPDADHEALRLLSTSDYIRRHLVACNPGAPADLLATIARWSHPLTQERIAMNPSTSVRTLEKLAMTERVEVLRALPRNPRTPAHVLQWVIARTTNPYIVQRAETALNAQLAVGG